jgi:hypothetical protein
MATIGTFTKKDETYQGAITTLTLKAKVNITPVSRTKKPRISGSTRDRRRSELPGPPPPKTATPTSRSSSTTPASRRRFSPAWSRATDPTSSSGPADPTGPGASRGLSFPFSTKGISARIHQRRHRPPAILARSPPPPPRSRSLATNGVATVPKSLPAQWGTRFGRARTARIFCRLAKATGRSGSLSGIAARAFAMSR